MTVTDDARTPAPAYDLADRYRTGGRRVLLTGVQAVARLLVEQHARDARAGKRVAHLVSGYPGSPLGGLDKLLAGLPHLRTEHDVHLVPGLNEELGATAVWGSQLDLPGGKTVDGVVGVWYGKGPGVDRACDAIRHGNVYGAHPDGGVLVLAGDDPGAKSSSLPCVSERTLASLQMPVVTPRNAEELVAFGMHGVALSRLSGCWTGVKVLADVADGLFTVERDFADVQITVPELAWEGRPWQYRQRVFASPPDSLFAEQDLFGPRWAAVEAYRDANDLDELVVDTADAWLTVIATGTAYDATRQALAELGLDDAGLARAGVRLLRIGMPFPLSGPKVRRAARGVRDVLVVEEKVSFVEEQVKTALYAVGAPRVFGKLDDRGTRLVPADGQLTADRLLPVLRKVLGQEVVLPDPPARPRTQLSLTPVSSVKRTPYFCSGCPHNRSTVVPEGSLSGGGIGCHALVTMAGRETAQVTGLTQMGGEGVQWIGQAPFAKDHTHLFQNVGDGTYFHSGQLALQACLAAGVTITYKILYNSAVAMTGAQDAQGALTVPQLTHKLVAEGVKRVVVVADDVRKYGRRADFAAGVQVRSRDELDAVQRELREVPGVTVIVYDQHCAAEARRLRKRGKMPVRTQRVVIDEQVCEGCGDCGQKSNCLSVQPVETELGRKTRIDQTSCNTDYSCLDGDCPSFLSVEVSAEKPARRSVPAPPAVADPVLPSAEGGYDVLLAGIGGTGIVTVNQVLATAALLDGLTAVGLDQTGLSQKAGPVTSHLRLGTSSAPVNRLSPGSAGCLLAPDLLVASDPKQLRLLSPARTVAVVSTSVTPTGDEVYDPTAAHPDSGRLLDALAQASRSLTTMDALGDAEALFGSTASANLLLVGAAYQAGALPVSAAAVERALEVNGVAVEANRTAFRWGRVAVADPDAYRDAVRPAAATARASRLAARAAELVGGTPLAGETARTALVRTELLLGWQGERTARHYLDVVVRAWQAERSLGERTDYSTAVARGVAHVTAYKDEYEVARLLSRPELLDDVRREVPGATDVRFRLHPPALRSMGLDRKIALPARVRPGLRALSHAKVLRGTALDPFGRAEVRRVERALAAEHTALVEAETAALSEASYDRAVALALAAEQVRGYEDVKLRNVERYREAVRALRQG